jgi:hypothetical protein
MGRRWLECAKSGHTRTARRTGQNDPLLPSKIGPANGMKARESGRRLKAWRRTRGNYSATAARLTLKARRLCRGRSRSDRSALAHHTRRTGSTRSAGGVSRTRTDSAHRMFGRPHRSVRERQPNGSEAALKAPQAIATIAVATWFIRANKFDRRGPDPAGRKNGGYAYVYSCTIIFRKGRERIV